MEQQILECVKRITKDDVFIYNQFLSIDKKSGFSNICYFEFIVCAIFIKPKNNYLRFPASYYDFFNGYTISQIPSEPDFIRVHFDSLLDIENMKNAFLKIIKSISAPPTFDVCSRYAKCSDALKCLHPEPRHSLECTYRKKLQDGIVFFGKNRNID